MRLAVTGASGFVGGAVCRAAAASGLDVHAFGRRPGVDPTHVGHARYRSWDITTGPLPDPPVAVDAVVHCAASVSDWTPRREALAVTVGGTAAVLASFPLPARIVVISTASVYDPYRPTVRAAEDQAPVRRYDTPYAAAKAAAERALLASGRDAVVLRPHAVYGPGDRVLVPRVLAAVRGRRLWAVGDGTQLQHLTAVHNLVDACLLAATGPVRGGVFNIADESPLPLDTVLRMLLAQVGVDAEPRYLPARVALPLAALAEFAARLARRPEPPPLTRYAVRHLAVERTLDLTAARRDLGYQPAPTSFEALKPA